MEYYQDFIKFKVNGIENIVKADFDFDTTLNDFIRDNLHLKGTKITCHEGGCGVCIVNGVFKDPFNQEQKSLSINSCLFPLYSCNNWEFTTIEGIGCRSTKLHPIQQRLAENNGSQCGYCSPGFVMNMYSLLSNNLTPDKQAIEKVFDGNICRCTGYRSILDAMKSFAIDEKPIDIEDLHRVKCLNIPDSNKNKNVLLKSKTSKWFAPSSLSDLIYVLNALENSNYRFIAGNTAKGIFKEQKQDSFIVNIQNIKELHEISRTENSLKIGSNITLNALIEIFKETSQNQTEFEYLLELSELISKVANTATRNIATWAGNLIIKKEYPSFPSDIYVGFKTVDAILTIKSSSNKEFLVDLKEFLKFDMKNKFIYSIEFKKIEKSKSLVKMFKVMPRSQASHAYITAGFRLSLNNNKVIENALITFGGLESPYFESKAVPSFLANKDFRLKQTVQNACELLESELKSENEFLKSLCVNLFYKFALFASPGLSNQRLVSAIDSINDTREVSISQQSFPSHPELFPLTEPIAKTNSFAQTTGESIFNSDLPPQQGQLEAALILSNIANCQIQNIDIEEAFRAPGVKKIVLAKDIPGRNNIFPFGNLIPGSKEELFAEDYVSFAGQPLGLIIAETYRQAHYAASLVNVTYKNHKMPILTIEDAIQANSFHPKVFSDFESGNVAEAILNSKYKLNGQFFAGAQYHFYLENLVAISTPTEDGFDIDCGSQWLDYVQKAVGQVVRIKNLADIEVKTKQIGGGFGGKASRAAIVACAAAVGSALVKKPVRLFLDLNTNMKTAAKRFPSLLKYNVCFDENGKINGLKVNWYSDAGYLVYDDVIELGYPFFDNCYSIKNMHVEPFLVKTNTPMNTAMRAPYTFPAISLIEYVIEHIAMFLEKDSLLLRKLNMYEKSEITHIGLKMPDFNLDKLLDSLITSSDYEKRKSSVKEFNENNRWKKRGISLVPMKYGAMVKENFYSTMVSVFNGDGSVAITHGGIEIGQGINTKISQVCAYALGIPLEKVTVKSTHNSVSANSQWTGGSVTTEVVAKGVIECCKIINANLEPIRKIMPENSSWNDLVSKAFFLNIDLSARYFVTNDANDTNLLKYNIFAAACTEIIIDVLTGDKKILRTDILYDCGTPLNGLIDIGQAEGAFAMGLGSIFLENVQYDKKNGINQTHGTWEYFPPLSKDMPEDFRVSFLENSHNTNGVLGAKCVGEPPLVLSISALLACKKAIEAARLEVGNNEFFDLHTPITSEKIQSLCMTNSLQFDV